MIKLPPALQQPTTVAAIAILLGIAAACVILYIGHGTTQTAMLVGAPIAAAVLATLEDNSTAAASKSSVDRLVNDAIMAIVTRRLTPAVITDVETLFAGASTPPAPMPPAVALSPAPPPAPAAETAVASVPIGFPSPRPPGA